MQTLPIEWRVLTPDNPPEGDYVYFAITPRDYENLSRGMADILRWMEEASWRLEYYGANDGD